MNNFTYSDTMAHFHPPPREDRDRDRFHHKGAWVCDYCGNLEVKLRCDSCGAPIPKKYFGRWAIASY